MKKRNLVFVTAVGLLVAGVTVYAPVYRALMAAGLVPYDNAGNEIEVERTYEDGEPLADFLNGIEEGKREVVDTYTNYLPFYLSATTGLKELKRGINAPLQTKLQSWGDELYRQNRLAKKNAKSGS